MESFIQIKHEKSLTTTFPLKKLTFLATFIIFKGIGNVDNTFPLISTKKPIIKQYIMKRFIYLLLLIFFLPLTGCQEKTDAAAEEEAIKAVIIDETTAFRNQNLVALLETLIQDDHFIYISIGSNGYHERVGWDSNYAYYRKAASADWSDWSDFSIERSNWKIDVFGETAYVTFNQKENFKLDEEPMITHSKEIRLLKKVKGEWKISAIQWIDLSSFEAEGEAVGKEL